MSKHKGTYKSLLSDSLDDHWRGESRPTSPDVHHHLLSLPCVDEYMVLLTTVHEVLCQSSVLCVVAIAVSDEPDTAVHVVSEVCSVKGEEEGGQDSAPGEPPHFRMSDTQTQAFKNWGRFIP